MTKYLKSLIHYLNVFQAARYEAEGWEVWQEADGTWSAAELVDNPVQPGQQPWRRISRLPRD